MKAIFTKAIFAFFICFFAGPSTSAFSQSFEVGHRQQTFMVHHTFLEK
jgi:hypothetical protein